MPWAPSGSWARWVLCKMLCEGCVLAKKWQIGRKVADGQFGASLAENYLARYKWLARNKKHEGLWYFIDGMVRY